MVMMLRSAWETPDLHPHLDDEFALAPALALAEAEAAAAAFAEAEAPA
jgi:hypothetical protein